MFLGISSVFVAFWFVCLAMRIMRRIVHLFLLIAALLAFAHFHQGRTGLRWGHTRFPGVMQHW